MALHFRSLTTRFPYWWMYFAGTLLLIVSGWLWWSHIYLSPANVFWGMLDTSFSTKSLTSETIQQSGTQGSMKQLVQYELGDLNRARSFTTITQGDTFVETEIIGTRDADYSRYRTIKTTQKNAAGKSLDVSNIQGIWAKADDTAAANGATGSGRAQLLAQAVLGIGLPLGSVPVPIGNLSLQQRQQLMELITSQNVYDTSFKNVARTHKNGRLEYTYDVKIQTILYVRMMKQFAHDLGMRELDSTDPNSFQSSGPMEVKLTVDAQSRRLVGIEVPSSGYAQRYSGYGQSLRADIPAKTIPVSELQKRLGEL